jgi:hypothetical protein
MSHAIKVFQNNPATIFLVLLTSNKKLNLEVRNKLNKIYGDTHINILLKESGAQEAIIKEYLLSPIHVVRVHCP